MGRIRLQKRELVWFGCFYIFLLPQTMLPSNDKYANQSCCFGQHKMATLFGVVEKYTHNQFQLSESMPLHWWYGHGFSKWNKTGTSLRDLRQSLGQKQMS